jgi:hypothetical protein
MDKRAEALLRDALAGALQDEGRHYVDLGDTPAIYRIEPPGSEAVVAMHPSCRANDGDPFVTVKLGTPRAPELVVPCLGCGVLLPLRPPAEVVAYGRSGLVAAARALPH